MRACCHRTRVIERCLDEWDREEFLAAVEVLGLDDVRAASFAADYAGPSATLRVLMDAWSASPIVWSK